MIFLGFVDAGQKRSSALIGASELGLKWARYRYAKISPRRNVFCVVFVFLSYN